MLVLWTNIMASSKSLAGDHTIRLNAVMQIEVPKTVLIEAFMEAVKTASLRLLPTKEEIDPEYSPKQAANIKGVSVKTLRRRIASGELKSYQLGKGGRIIIRKSDLDALVIRRNLNSVNF